MGSATWGNSHQVSDTIGEAEKVRMLFPLKFHIFISIFHTYHQNCKDILIAFVLRYEGYTVWVSLKISYNILKACVKTDSQFNLQHFANSCNLSLSLHHKISFRLSVISAFSLIMQPFMRKNSLQWDVLVLKASAIFLSMNNKFKKRVMGPCLESVHRMKHREGSGSLFLLIIIIL